MAADTLSKLTDFNILQAKRAADSNTSLAGTTTRWTIIVGAAGILASLFLSLLISISISARLARGSVRGKDRHSRSHRAACGSPPR